MEGTLTSAKIQMARMGFKVVPTIMCHDTKGVGLLYMDGDGIRFEPVHGEPLILTWEQFDKGPEERRSDGKQG